LLVGIISDTHDNLDRIRKAVRVFKERQVELVIHCGDWVAPSSVREFAGLRLVTVLGNNDGDLLLLNKLIGEVGGRLEGRFASIDLNGKKAAIIHGEYAELIEAIARSNMYDVVMHGHTHSRRMETIGKALVLNPGWDSVIIYNPQDDSVEFIDT